MEDEKKPERVVWSSGPMKWTAEITCDKCGWPWYLTGISESTVVDIHQTIQCPNCGQRYTMDLHHE